MPYKTIISRLAGEDTKQRVKQASEMLKDTQIRAALTDANRRTLEEFVRNTPIGVARLWPMA
jgi:hypothetical protein